MKSQFIPVDQALDLKNLGFNKKCFTYWYTDNILSDAVDNEDSVKYYGDIKFDNCINDYLIEGQLCTAPTFHQAFKWIRDNHKLNGEINRDVDGWQCIITEFAHGNKCIFYGKSEIEKYEDSELECLIKMIEIIKQNNPAPIV